MRPRRRCSLVFGMRHTGSLSYLELGCWSLEDFWLWYKTYPPGVSKYMLQWSHSDSLVEIRAGLPSISAHIFQLDSSRHWRGLLVGDVAVSPRRGGGSDGGVEEPRLHQPEFSYSNRWLHPNRPFLLLWTLSIDRIQVTTDASRSPRRHVLWMLSPFRTTRPALKCAYKN